MLKLQGMDWEFLFNTVGNQFQTFWHWFFNNTPYFLLAGLYLQAVKLIFKKRKIISKPKQKD